MKKIQIELGTERLRSAVNKVYKGAGNTNIFMTTLIMGIEGRDGNITLSCTDRVANIKVTLKDVIGKGIEFYTNTTADTFKKLLDKTQSATVLLTIEKDRIVFSGSGDANLEVICNDEDGGDALAKIPEIVVEGDPVIVKRSDLDKFEIYLKSSYPTSIENPAYIGYRVGNGKAMTYNNFGANLVEIDWDANILIPENIVKLFTAFEDDAIEVTISENNKIKLRDSTVEITGSLRPENYVEEFELGKFENLFYSKLFDKSVTINKNRLARAFDRLNLFIDKNDNNVVNMEVDSNSVMFITFARNCVEKVDFFESENDKVITTRVGIDTFAKAVESMRGENITICFGDRAALRISDEEDKAYLLVPYARES